MRKALFAMLPLLAACATTQPVATNELARYEQQLNRAIVRGNYAAMSQLTSENFTCVVPGISPGLKIALQACAAIGHDQTAKMPELFAEQSNAAFPRSATIDSIDVEQHADSAVVRMTHTYRGWWPHDFNLERRSHVTDTWQRTGDRWQIVRRVSEPIAPTASGR
jgi:hypothetical protein